MKKAILITVSVLVVFIAALFVLPVFFKKDILRLIERQSARYIKSELTIGDVSLSMFKSFPHLNVSISDVAIASEADTLVSVPRLDASVNLSSLISGEAVEINHITLRNAEANLVAYADGKVNWDILIESDAAGEATPQPAENPDTGDKSDRPIRISDIRVQGLQLNYADRETEMLARVGPVDIEMKGNWQGDLMSLDIDATIARLLLNMDNTTYLNLADLAWKTGFTMDLDRMVFGLDGILTINRLPLTLAGSLGMPEEGFDLDLKLFVPESPFIQLLSLLPPDLLKETQGIKTEGNFRIDLAVKGLYTDTQLPGFDLAVSIKEGSVRFPELTEAIDQIGLDLSVNHPQGPLSLTSIDLKRMGFRLAGNPFELSFHATNPDDLAFRGSMNGTIDLGGVQKALPLEAMDLSGIITANLDINGKLAYIEKEQYEKMQANGKLAVNNLLVKGEALPQEVSIPAGSLTITPARMTLDQLLIGMGSSDLDIKGYIGNYLPYLFKNQTLTGQVAITSQLLNLNELLVSDEAAADTSATAPLSIIEIPGNLALGMTANVKQLLYDQLTVNNITGNIQLANQTASLKNLAMELLQGSITLNGAYSTRKPTEPTIDFNLNINKLDMEEAVKSFSMIRETLPVAMNCTGKIGASMKFAAQLDKEMSPVMTTANGGGTLTTEQLLIKDNPTLSSLSSVLKNEDLSRLSIGSLKIDFTLEQGNLTVKPFTTQLANQPTTIYGTQSAAGDMDYTISMNVPRKYFGSEIDKLLSSVPGTDKITALDVDVKIGGTLDKPTVSPDLSKALRSIEKAAKEEVKGNILKGIQNLFK